MRQPFRLIMLIALVVPALALAGLATQAASVTWSEAGLKADGKVQEVNAGARRLYVTDTRANEVWRVDPATGAYVAYAGLTGAIDARPDPAGNIWVSDWSAKTLVRIDGEGTATSWQTNGLVLWGSAIDDAGRIWVTDSSGANGRVLRFDPSTRQLCGYLLPAGGASEYLLYRSGKLWLGDYANGRLLQLDTATNAVALWNVGASAEPEALALDANGLLWYADHAQALLGRLNPSTGELVRYALPAGTKPGMLTLADGRVWYTEEGLGTVGALDPAVATGQSGSAALGSATLLPGCTILPPGTTQTLTTRSGTLAFTDLAPSLIADSGGWTVYQLPAGAKPWGIAESSGNLWIGDGGRQKLIRLQLNGESGTQTPTPTTSATPSHTPTPSPNPSPSTTPTSTAGPSPTPTSTPGPRTRVLLPSIYR